MVQDIRSNTTVLYMYIRPGLIFYWMSGRSDHFWQTQELLTLVKHLSSPHFSMRFIVCFFYEFVNDSWILFVLHVLSCKCSLISLCVFTVTILNTFAAQDCSFKRLSIYLAAWSCIYSIWFFVSFYMGSKKWSIFNNRMMWKWGVQFSILQLKKPMVLLA